ncbi:hypothetical protein F5878DRAFT_661061 [Lentinula raphanica]|uniref:Uncharacterized protein n=1 Tax=Lentinula raphanica TaxID=153919 RepID=A0AA38UEA3_9AGAR|nr:hypothetical protein F5878DRAFT_661061 [Lentinula raphanica]
MSSSTQRTKQNPAKEKHKKSRTAATLASRPPLLNTKPKASSSTLSASERDKSKIDRVLNYATEIQQATTRPNSVVIKSMLASAQEASDGLTSKRASHRKETAADREDDDEFQVGAFYVLTTGIQLVRNRNKLMLDDQYFTLKGGSSSVKPSPRLYNELVRNGLGARSERSSDPTFRLRKSMSYADIISHLWSVLPLLMQYLEDMDEGSGSLTKNPFYPSIYRNEQEKCVPNLFFIIKEGRSRLEHVGNQLLFPTGSDIYDLYCKSKKSSIQDRVVFLATLDEISRDTQMLWRSATVLSRDKKIDPHSALLQAKAEEEAALLDKKGKRKALTRYISVSSSEDEDYGDMSDKGSKEEEKGDDDKGEEDHDDDNDDEEDNNKRRSLLHPKRSSHKPSYVEALEPPFTQKRPLDKLFDDSSDEDSEQNQESFKRRKVSDAESCIEITDHEEIPPEDRSGGTSSHHSDEDTSLVERPNQEPMDVEEAGSEASATALADFNVNNPSDLWDSWT